MIIFIYLIFAIYIITILVLFFGFYRINNFENEAVSPETKFSIIVAFRNENHNLPELIISLENLNYPENFFEIILVDDNSTEKFDLSTVKPNMDVIIIDNVRKSNSPKKDAITMAIYIAKNHWIITTDADCIVP